MNLTIQTGVANAISDLATLSLAGGGAAGTADFGYVNLGAGVNETVGNLLLGTLAQVDGTYGSSLSNATYQNDEYFSGTGIVTVVPEPGTLMTLLSGAGLLMAFQRRVVRRQS